MSKAERYRNEWKYLIDTAQKEAICSRLAPVMQLDDNARDGGYLLRSLYFDDYFNSCYDEKLSLIHILEQKYAQAPNDLDTIMTYCGFLWHCLDQGLMQGQVERMNRNLFDTLIHKKIKLDSPHIADYIRCIKNCMALGNYTEANAMLESAREFWPRSEELLLLKIQYLADLQRADEIQTLLDELEANSAYLSDKAKEAIAFWRG